MNVHNKYLQDYVSSNTAFKYWCKKITYERTICNFLGGLLTHIVISRANTTNPKESVRCTQLNRSTTKGILSRCLSDLIPCNKSFICFGGCSYYKVETTKFVGLLIPFDIAT